MGCVQPNARGLGIREELMEQLKNALDGLERWLRTSRGRGAMDQFVVEPEAFSEPLQWKPHEIGHFLGVDSPCARIVQLWQRDRDLSGATDQDVKFVLERSNFLLQTCCPIEQKRRVPFGDIWHGKKSTINPLKVYSVTRGDSQFLRI